MRKLAIAMVATHATLAFCAQGARAQGAPDFSDPVPAVSAPKQAPKPRKPAPPPAPKPAAKPQEHAVSPPLPLTPPPQGGETVTQESTKFHAWTVACNTLNASPDSRQCVAKTGVLRGKDDPRPILFLGVIKNGADQRFVLQTPTTTELKPGVKIDFGKGNTRQFQFASCEPALCTADAPLDGALAEDLRTAGTATVYWTSIGVGEVKVTFGLEGAREAIQFLATR
jgi:invasion protein IalB